jgi:hypothetical protein
MTVHMAGASEALTWVADDKGHYHANVIVAEASQESGNPWKPVVMTMTALQVAASGAASMPSRQMAQLQFPVPSRAPSKGERGRVLLQDEASRRIGSSEFKVK